MCITPLGAGIFRAALDGRAAECASPPSARGDPGRRWPGGVAAAVAAAAAAAKVAASAATGVERGRTPLRRRCSRAVAARFKFLPARFGCQTERSAADDEILAVNTHLVLRCPGDSTQGEIVDGIGALASQHSARSAENAHVSAARAADANDFLLDVHCKNEASHPSRHGSPHHRPATKGANSEVDDVGCGNVVVVRKYSLTVSRCQIREILFPERHRLDFSVYSDVDVEVNPLWIN